MNTSHDFQRGEMAGAARAVLAAYKQQINDSNHNNGKNFDALEAALMTHVEELRRLIGNRFQLRNKVGDPVQLAAIVLFMSGLDIGQEFFA